MIHIRTFGPPEVTLDGGAAPPELNWRKNIALLVYLARSPRRARTREHLIGLLWGDTSESASRHSLSEALRIIRRSAGEGTVEGDGETVRLGDAVRTDCEAFETRAAAGDWAGAAALFGGEFLEGFAVPDASEFDLWVTAQRAGWRRRGVEALTRWSDWLLAAGDVEGAVSAAERALAFAPTSDAALRALLRSRALAGDRGGALAAYEEFVARLRTDVGATPEAETERLAERVRRERVWRAADVTPGHGGAASRRVPLVGRERELEGLVAAWRDCRAGPRAALCALTGDPGSGKTRLTEELLARARLDGAAVAAMRAVEADLNDPWSGIFALARGGLLDARGIAAAGAGALAAFAQRLPEWADRFQSVRGVAPGPPARALAEVVRAAVEEQPVVLCADDAQWLDRESLVALGGVLRDVAATPLMMVLADAPPPRPELDEQRARIGRDWSGTHVQLAPLDGPALRALARWALPRYGDDALDRVTRRVAADSAGLPLLAVELVHAVALGLELHDDAPPWPEPHRTLDQTLPGDLPDAIVAAIRVGFRRLSVPAQRVLGAAAVLGPRVPAAVLGRATGLGDDALAQALDELEWQRWLVAEPRGYGFVARIVQGVVWRDMLTAGQRQRVREAAGVA